MRARRRWAWGATSRSRGRLTLAAIAGAAAAGLASGAAIARPLGVSSVGPDGIDALRLHRPPYNLTGRKIGLGQVEIGRPGRFGLDKAVGENRSVETAGLFALERPVASDDYVDAHAHAVAGVMVGKAKASPGVAPGARLYASAAGFSGRNGQAQECLATQHVAQQNGGDVRAINFSFGEPLSQDPRFNPVLDGQSLLTLCVDWSARVHDTLYTIAGNQGRGGISIPTDTFNGINVAYTTRYRGQFSKVDFSNLGNVVTDLGRHLIGLESNFGRRRSVGLVAPGDDVSLVDLDGEVFESSGTSFATPHVAGTVALLQEFGDRQLAANQPHWTLDSRRHPVMKAVLLNSADKLRDRGDGLRLGMSRDVWTEDAKTWLESDAYDNVAIPLDAQLGTGQLNAYRAYQQFAPGQHAGGREPVPSVGWDYGAVSLGAGGAGADATPTEDSGPEPDAEPLASYRDYAIAAPLQGGSHVAVTLAWSRHVELADGNDNGRFDAGESFRDLGLNDLDLYLMPLEADDEMTRRTCASVSPADSVEHLFCPVPETGRYKIRVRFRTRLHGDRQPYGLAWWTMPARDPAE